jgi:hypothetical protein
VADSRIFTRKENNTGTSVVIEDDGRVAYAYLLNSDGRVIADVWLYNCGAPPKKPEWTSPKKMPFMNPEAFARPDSVSPIRDEADVAVEWKVDRDSVRSAHIFVRGEVWAVLEPGSRPGWSRMALRDGPLAKVLLDPQP